MSAARPGPTEIRDYLLRRMDEAARTAFESAYFADDRLLDRVEEEEDGLVSDYVLGRLTDTDRRRFEESLLGSPYYKERVETTSRLRQRLSQHRAFDRRRDGTPAPRPLPARRLEDAGRKEEGRLFPGSTGTVIAFALLAILLVAAVLSALTLRSELARARAAVPARAPARLASPSAGVVPAAAVVVLVPPQVSGPTFRRVTRAPGAALLVVVPSRLLPPEPRSFALVVSDPEGQVAWRSGRLPRDPAPDAGDIALRLPAGIPADGRSSVTLLTEGPAGRHEVSLGLLEIETAER